MKKLREYYNKEYSVISIYVIKTILIVIALGLMIYGVSKKYYETYYLISGVLTPLILGIILAYLFKPLMLFFETRAFEKIENRRSRRTLAVAMTFFLIASVILFILLLLVITVTKSVSNIAINDIWSYVESIVSDFSGFWETVEEKLTDLNINLGTVGAKIGEFFNNIKHASTTLLFANVMAFYFLLDSNIVEYFHKILFLFTDEKTREKLYDLSKDANQVFSGYIRGQSLDALLVGIMVTIALLIIGVPYAVVIGLLTGLGNLIPYVGPVVGFASLIIVCLAEGSVSHLISGGIVLAIVMAVDGNIINPKLLSNNVAVHPVLIILALIAGSQIGGIIGMLLAVPVAALGKMQFDKYLDRKRLSLPETAGERR